MRYQTISIRVMYTVNEIDTTLNMSYPDVEHRRLAIMSGVVAGAFQARAHVLPLPPSSIHSFVQLSLYIVLLCAIAESLPLFAITIVRLTHYH